MSVPDEIIPLIVWVRTTRVLLRAYEFYVTAARRADSDVVMARTDREWCEAFRAWLQEADL